MQIRQRKCQNVPVLTAFVAVAGLLWCNASAHAQTSGGSSSSSGNSLLGGSSGGSSGSGSSSGSSGGTTSSFLGASGGLGGTTGSLTNGANSFTNAGLGLSTGSTFTPTPAGSIGPSATNILGPYYVNPLAGGLPNSAIGSTGSGSGANSTKRFGQPLYATANNNLNTANAGRGAGGAGGRGNSSMSTGAAATMSVGPRFTQTIGWKPTIAGGTGLQTNLQGLLARSTTLPNAKNFQVSLEGQTVVLRGNASDDHERRLAAAILSMEPGVYGIRNEIKVQPADQGTPAPIPSPGSAPVIRQP